MSKDNDKNIISPSDVDRIIGEIRENSRVIREFRDSKKFIEVLNDLVGIVSKKETMVIDDTDSEYWNQGVELTFNLLVDVAQKIHHYIDFPVIKYESVYITLKEFHGQGSYRLVELDFIDKDNYLSFSDVEEFLENEMKPRKYYVLDTIKKGLNAVESINGDMVDCSDEELCIQDVWEYVVNNLL